MILFVATNFHLETIHKIMVTLPETNQLQQLVFEYRPIPQKERDPCPIKRAGNNWVYP